MKRGVIQFTSFNFKRIVLVILQTPIAKRRRRISIRITERIQSDHSTRKTKPLQKEIKVHGKDQSKIDRVLDLIDRLFWYL